MIFYDKKADDMITMIEHKICIDTIKAFMADIYEIGGDGTDAIYFSALKANWTELLEFFDGFPLYDDRNQLMLKYAISIDDFDAIKAIDIMSDEEIYITNSMINKSSNKDIQGYLKTMMMLKEGSDK